MDKLMLVQELLAFNRQLTFLYIWQGTPTFHISTFPHFHALLFLVFSLFLCVSHSKAFPLQSKPGRNSHSSNRYVCVVFAHRRDTQREREKKRPVSYFSSVWASLQGFIPSPGHPISPTQRPEAERGRQNPCRINTKSSNGA